MNSPTAPALTRRMRNQLQRLLTIIAVLGLVIFAGASADAKGKKKHKHHDAHAMTKEHLKKDGVHEIHKNGKHTASAEVAGAGVVPTIESDGRFERS